MKRSISKIMSLILVSLCIFTMPACSSKDADTLYVGMECAYAPFNWTQTTDENGAASINGGGYAGGYDVEIAKIIAEKMGKKLLIVKTEWGGLTPAITSGKIDMIIAGMTPTDERKETIDFSDNYYTSELVIVVKKDSTFASATSIADFAGAKITGQLETFHYTVIDQINGVTKETAMDTFPDMIVAVTSGKIDGYVSELPGAKSAIKSNTDLTYVTFSQGNGFTYSENDASIAVGVEKGSELTAKINEILADLTEETRNTLMQTAIDNQPLSE